MNNLLTHYPVNWIDGMKLSSSHFIAVQDFVTDSVRDAIALQTTDLNYGLQLVAGDTIKMHVLMDHYNCLQLTLEECHAVTPSGIRIQISTSQEGIKNVNISKINDIVNNIKFLKNMELNADEYFSIKNNADGIIFLRNKLKVLWKKNNMDSNLLNTKVHHNH